MGETVVHLDQAQDVPESQWADMDSALASGSDIELKPEAEKPREEPPAEGEETQEAEPVSAEPEPERDAQVNYEQEIPLPDHAEPVKLGELKDRFMEYQRRETALQQREAEISSEYGKLAQTNAEMQANGAPLSGEQRQAVAVMQQQRIQREGELMLKAIPEWKDQAAFTKDRQEIVEVMKPYGITEDMVNGVADHRIALLYKHHLDLVRRLRVAEATTAEIKQPAKKPKGKPLAGAARRSQQDKLVQQAIVSSDESVKYAAMDAIIG